jgi:hypothetical protein
MGGLMDDYRNLRTVPALFSIVFALASLYQFGGIATVEIVWVDYTLTTQHAMFASLGAYAIAFASSETKEFRNYRDWEQVAIAAGPALIIAHQYVPQVGDLVANNQPLMGVVGFLLVLTSWGVAVR